jgi:hypothetical protein
MKNPLTILKKIWKGWCYFCGGLAILAIFLILFGICVQSKIDRTFVRKNLIPAVNYVESFRDSKGRLPTQQEFESWNGTNFSNGNKPILYYPNKPDFMNDWGVSGRDFLVGAEIGGFGGAGFHYYRSWDKKDFSE